MEKLQTISSGFGELLKTYRKRKRLTQQQLAQRLGVHANTVSSWELGTYLPATRGLVLELARYLVLDELEARRLLEASLTTLSPYWYVPFPRNPFFTGREEVLEELHRWLHTEQVVALAQSYALQGLGGIGKTQLALEYTYRHALEYSAIFWIGAETCESIVSSLLRIAEILGLPEREDKDQRRVLEAVQHWLSRHSQWLLIWDNVEDLDLFNRFLPPARSGAILLTTRCQTLGTLAQGLNLSPMEHEEGMLFLLRRAKVLDLQATAEQVRHFAACLPAHYAAAAELVTALGGLSLALDQAGAYLEATQCGLPAYLDLFRTRRAALLQQRGEGLCDHPASVSTTLRLAITATTRRHPALWELLRICALLQPDAIPEEIFLQAGEHLGPALKAVGGDPLEWNRVVGIACAYSLLSRQPEEHTLSLHRLVQAVLLDMLTQAEQEQWNRKALTALDVVFPHEWFASVHAGWKQRERLSPHVQLCLRRAEILSEPLVLASLAYKLAEHLRELSRYAEAEPLYQRALDVREHALGPEHPEVASSLGGLANLYHEQDKYQEAEPLLQRALCILEQAFGPAHLETAEVLNTLAHLYFEWGKYAEAESFYLRAWHIWKQTQGSQHPNAARGLNNLAGVYLHQGRYAEAAACYQRALSILEQALGSDHSHVAYVLHNLADLSVKQDRYAEAERLYQRALHIRERLQRPDHPDLAVGLARLADLYVRQGRSPEARPLLQRALQVLEHLLGPDDRHVAEVLTTLAHISVQQGEYIEAERLYRRALSILEQAVGPDHPEVAEPLHHLATLAVEQGQDEQAERLYQRALSIREQCLGQHHPETAETLHSLAVLYQKQGKPAEALALVERALSIRSQSLGDAHSKTIATRTLSTQLLQEQVYAEIKTTPARRLKKMPYLHPEEGHAEDARSASDPSCPANDALREFLDACCELHSFAWCRASDLWQAYQSWVQDHRERFPLSRRAFTAQLKTCGCRADRTNTARIWRGIALVKKEA